VQPPERAEGAERPDWLVGADEGLLAEQGHEWDTAPRDHKPVLRRIDSPRETPAAPAKSEPPKAWTAAAPSVPKLTIVPKRERPQQAPEISDEPPTTSAPEESLEHEESEARVVAPVIPIRPPDEPLWMVWAEILATHRPLQIGLAVTIVGLVTVAYWPRQDGRGVPLGEIRKHPEKFEGRSVKVQGKVGEVFDIGSGYVFHLIQGRDTVVVFSPARRPETHAKVRVAGNVTTGYLDGVARVAIFEAAAAPPIR
jgi:hypothetical protein